ncbi:ABC transporter related [Ignisphaera aggregans DSM 17230]|uniref:ABC transporter related n=1 Tax=Ignisphaera aggregans (strain DSM 17230 / JCM 13409 / AQ1.S1) TaxID=583356 RepID=E0SQB9_IGNAA|nr:ABC transporter related [Ignisphaera aggregans DSM 17230]
MIKLKDITVIFNNRKVLSISSVIFSNNSIILGPNGSGKTTLIKTIVGLYKPLHGLIEVNGVDMIKNSVPRLMSTNIESAYVLPGTYLDDLVKIYCNAFNCNYQDVQQLLSYIKPKAKEFWKLSAGEKKWVTTVLALYADTKVTLLDEPFEDLDPWLVRKLAEEIHKASKRKQIILTLHSIYLLKEFIDWDLFFMFEGSLYGSVKSQEVFKIEVVLGRDPDAVLVFRMHGEEYSLIKDGKGKGIPLREVSDLAQLYSRSRLGF